MTFVLGMARAIRSYWRQLMYERRDDDPDLWYEDRSKDAREKRR